MGVAMRSDFAIVSTAFEMNFERSRSAGAVGAVAPPIGTVVPFFLGAAVAWGFCYRDAV